jgi:hypothetical protein
MTKRDIAVHVMEYVRKSLILRSPWRQRARGVGVYTWKG